MIHEHELKILKTEEVDATTLTRLRPPPTANMLRITAESDVRWSDFTVPTSTEGHKLTEGQTFLYPGSPNTFRVIGGVVQVSYYETLP